MNNFREDGISPSMERLGHPVDREVDRTHQAAQLLRFFELTGLSDTFSAGKTMHERYSSLCAVDNDEIIGVMRRVNGTLRNLPEARRGYTAQTQYIGGGSLKEGVDYMPPHPDDKDTLLNELLNAVREVNDPHPAAALLGFGVNSIHPYEDGNGRISRLLYRGLTHGFGDKDSTFPAIIGYSGEEISNTNGEIFKNAVFQMMKEESTDFYQHQLNGQMSMVPKTAPALFDGSRNPLGQTQPPNPGTENRVRILTAAHEKNMVDFLCAGIGNAILRGSIKNPQRSILMNHAGQDYLLIDNFIRNASDDEVNQSLDIISDISRRFVRRFIQELGTPHQEQLNIGLDTLEHGVKIMKFGEACSMVADRVFTLRVH